MGRSSPPPVCHRFFFALKPDARMAADTHDFALAELGSHGLLHVAHLHMTLALTEDVPAPDGPLVAALLRAGDAVRGAPFSLALDRLVATSHTVSLRPSQPPAALHALQSAISAAMAVEGVALRADWRFDPHETLAYRKGTPLTRTVAPFHWPVDAFMLVHSAVGQHRHETIGTWPLTDANPPA